MTSTAATQSLNFVPQWLRSSTNPETPTTNSSPSSSGNAPKASSKRLCYSISEILALRANVSPVLEKEIRNEIVKNLEEVKHIYRPQILIPSTLNGLTEDESAEMNSSSNFICGRNSGGATRPNNNSSQSQSDTRKHRDSGSFTNRIRTSDDREHPQPSRRPHGNLRNPFDDWRRPRGDEDAKDHKDDSNNSGQNSTSRHARNLPNKRGERSMEQRTKSDDKWNSNDNRTHSFDSNQTRGSGWRKHATMPDRTQPRRPQPLKDEIPEWMDDNLDGDVDAHPGLATFEQDGTYIRASSTQSNTDEKQPIKSSQSNSNESLSQINNTTNVPEKSPDSRNHLLENSSKPNDSVKNDKSVSPVAETVAVNMTNLPASEPSNPVQQPIPAWEEEFDHHDVATTVVESTLAEDFDDASLMSSQTKVLSMVHKPTRPIIPNIPQKPVIVDDKQWYYKDPQNRTQGPFTSNDMERWLSAGYFSGSLPVKRAGDAEFSTIQKLKEQFGRLPFRNESSSQQVRQQQQQATSANMLQKTLLSSNHASSVSNNPYMDQFMNSNQSSRHPVQNALSLSNRPTSMELMANDLKRVSSQSQMLLHSPQSSSSMLPSTPLNDPAILCSQQRNPSSLNQQVSNTIPYDDNGRHFRQLVSHSNANNNNSPFYLSNASTSQQSNDIVSRLTQAAQMHSKMQQDKMEDQRRREFQHYQQQQNDYDLQRLRLYSQMEPDMYKRQENEFRYKSEQVNHRQMINDTPKKPPDMDAFTFLQQSAQSHKEQAQIDALKAENVRRYQQHYQELSQQPNLLQMSDGYHWSRPTSFANEMSQSSAYIDMQDAEQERRIQEAATALLAHQNAQSETSLADKPISWMQNIFADSSDSSKNYSRIPNPHANHQSVVNSSSALITDPNQQATEAILSLLNINPRNRAVGNAPSNSWNNYNSNYQEVHRQQQMQTDVRSQMPSNWENQLQRSEPQSQSASSTFWDQQYSSSTGKQGATNSNKSSYVPILRTQSDKNKNFDNRSTETK